MTLRIRVLDLIKLCVYICVIINTDALLFVGFNIKSPFSISIVVILISLVLTFTRKNAPSGFYDAVQSSLRPMGVLLLILIVEFLYSVGTYAQTPTEVFMCMTYFSYFLLIYPIMYIFTIEGEEKLLTNISLFASLILFLRVVQALLYNRWAVVIFPALLKYGSSGTRFGRLRLGVTCLGSVSTIYLFYKYLKSQKRIFGFCCIINLFAYIYVLQSRVSTIVIILVVSFMYIYRNKQTIKSLGFVFVALLIITYLVFTGFAEEAVESFEPESDMGGGSTLTRIYAIEHYYHSTTRSKLLGMGFINDSDVRRSLLVHRTTKSMKAYYSDLGLLGYYFYLGIVGMVIYAYFFLFFRRSSRKEKGIRPSCEQTLTKAVFVYYVLASTTILPLFAKQIFVMPFFWGIAVAYGYKSKPRIPT